MKRCWSILCLFVTCVHVSSVSGLDEEGWHSYDAVREIAEDKMFRLESASRERDVSFSFYGRILDQDRLPVVGAVITLNIARSSGNAEQLFSATDILQVTTDTGGLWSVENRIGRSLYVAKIEKEGYDFEGVEHENRNFTLSGAEGESVFVASKPEPVEFALRRRGKTACLSLGGFELQITQRSQSYALDVIRPVCQNVTISAKDVGGTTDLAHADATITATNDESNNLYRITVSSSSTGGVLWMDDIVYMAPEYGYGTNATFLVNYGEKIERHVYLNARAGQVFGRLSMILSAISNRVSHQTRLNVEIQSVGNPYGDRVLEDEPDLPYEARKKFIMEAEKDLRNGKRPLRPDLTPFREGSSVKSK